LASVFPVHNERISCGAREMLNTSVKLEGRLSQCPNCRSRRWLRNVFRCRDHLFCEECAVPILRGATKTLTTTCPRCAAEPIETVGFIEEKSSLHCPA
jgi:predicted Zn-ribbon and HTH transcriptional regulator